MCLKIVDKAAFSFIGIFSNDEKVLINKHLSLLLNRLNRNKIVIKKTEKNLVEVIGPNNNEITNFYLSEISIH